MKYQVFEFIFGYLLLITLCSCEKARIDNPLLNGYEYKLWYITSSEDDDPDFFYIDCYGKFYTLRLNTETGSFLYLSDSSTLSSGKWQYDSDSSIYLKNIFHTIKKGKYPIVHEYVEYTERGIEEYSYIEYLELIFLYNQITQDSIIIRDTDFPVSLIANQSDLYKFEEDINHYNKWGKKIKKSPLLGNLDYKLWYTGNKTSGHYFYCYYDKYGKVALLSLGDIYWRFTQSHLLGGYWYQKNNILYENNSEFKILTKNKKNDTLTLQNIKNGKEQLLIDPNIILKKK